MAFGSSLISSSSVWLHNCSIKSKIEGSIEVEALTEGSKNFIVDFAVGFGRAMGFARPLGDFEGFKDFAGSIDSAI